jgi:hypothetical protein
VVNDDHESSSNVTQTRASNYEGLIMHFEAHSYDAAGASMPRPAAVAEEFFDDQRVGAKIALCETEQQAFEFLGDTVLEVYAPDGVVRPRHDREDRHPGVDPDRHAR